MTSDDSTRSARWPALVVWVVWLGMAAAAVAFVARYGYSMPFADEWDSVDVAAGLQPMTISWLWSAHNEHRLPLPRLVYVALGKATGWNFRLMAQFSVAALALLAAALIVSARRVRGWTVLVDAVFPLLLLNWGQHGNLVWDFQICFTLGVTLSTLMLVPIALGGFPSLANAALVALLAIAAGACGAHGICYGLPIAVWLAFLAFCDRDPDGQPHPLRRLGLGSLAALVAAFVGLYFWGFSIPGHHGPPPSVWAVLRTGMEFVAGSFGPGGREVWPVSALVVLVALSSVAAAQVRIGIRQPEERPRAAGLLAFLAGLAILTAGIAWGRAFLGPTMGFSDRYVTLSTPMLVLVYLHLVIYGRPPRARRVERIMLVLVVVVAAVGTRKGLRQERETSATIENLVADARLGLSPAALAERHGERLAFGLPATLAHRLEVLREAGISPYETPVPESPVRVRPIAETAEPIPAIAWKLAAPGASFRQPFALAQGETLDRIDLRWSPHGRRWSDTLAWTLLEAAPDGSHAALAAGHLDARRDVHGEYVRLLLAPPVRGPRQLELEVASPADDRPAQLPVCRDRTGRTALRAFLFVSPTQ